MIRCLQFGGEKMAIPAVFTRLVAVFSLSILLAAAVQAQTDATAPWSNTANRPVAIDGYCHSHQPTARQGGDTIADAVAITLPFYGTGTTVGYLDDYSEGCPYTTQAPDVVYSITPATDVVISVDLYGSQYDTVVFVYRSPYYLVACDNDYYAYFGYRTSYIRELLLTAGETYYVVVDGDYDSGIYDIAVEEFVPCEIACDGVAEGEPPMAGNYVDHYNGGCESPEHGAPFQQLAGDSEGALVFCGVSGWYEHDFGLIRDTDWFVARFGAEGIIDISIETARDSYLFEMWPQDCSAFAIRQTTNCFRCEPANMTITGAPGSEAWLWVGPVAYVAFGDPETFSYVLELTGLEPGSTAVEHATWGQVKALFR
jgi:hypothetical protein